MLTLRDQWRVCYRAARAEMAARELSHSFLEPMTDTPRQPRQATLLERYARLVVDKRADLSGPRHYDWINPFRQYTFWQKRALAAGGVLGPVQFVQMRGGR